MKTPEVNWRAVRDQEVTGSNPVLPTILFVLDGLFSLV